MNTLRSNSTRIQHATRQQTADSRQQSLIDDRTIMNVLSKNPFQFQRIAFAILFILSNLLFFQPTQAQTFDHYSGYTCDVDTGCRAWINDSLVLYLPAPNEDCQYKFFFKFRTVNCTHLLGYPRPLDHMEIQPVAILLDFVDSDCGVNVKSFYADTNNIHRIESLMRLAEKTMVFNHQDIMSIPARAGDTNLYKGYYLYDTLSITPLVIDSTLTSDAVNKTSFIRPACRGLCISYFRSDSTSTIDTVYAKWHNCGNACCEIISSFCNVSSLSNVPSQYLNDGYSARIEVEVNYTGECDTTPSVACPNSSTNTKVTKFKSCRDYCQDVDGLDPFGITHIEKTKGVINLDEMPYFSDNLMKTLPNDVLLESTTNDLIINISEDIFSVKIVTLNGSEILNYRTKQSMKFVPISLHSLQNGLYLLVIESTKDGVITKPIIIQR